MAVRRTSGKKRRTTPRGDASQRSKDFVPLDTSKFLGFERVEHVPKSSYRDTSMSIIIPSREPWLHRRFIEHIQAIQFPMNQRRAMFFVTNAEVGLAYDEQVAAILSHPELSKWKYILSIEDDNLVPHDAVIKLCESIEVGPFDAVGGLYFVKGEHPQVQCYGDPREFERTGTLDFRPRDIVKAIKDGHIVECNGVAMGCTLYRTQVFRDIPRPWFVTSPTGTQDLAFCGKARAMGKRFAVDTRVRVGHADWDSGVVF